MAILPKNRRFRFVLLPSFEAHHLCFHFTFCLFANLLSYSLSGSSCLLQHFSYCKFFILHIHSLHSQLLIILSFFYWFHWFHSPSIVSLVNFHCCIFLRLCFAATTVSLSLPFVVVAATLHHRFCPSRTQGWLVFLIFLIFFSIINLYI